jgi:hypothetical protein
MSIMLSSLIILAPGANVINDYIRKCIAIETYTSMDNAVICNFLFSKYLSAVNHGKKSVVDNIGP